MREQSNGIDIFSFKTVNFITLENNYLLIDSLTTCLHHASVFLCGCCHVGPLTNSKQSLLN